MRHVMYILSAVAGVYANDSRIRSGLELVGARRSDEDLGSGN